MSSRHFDTLEDILGDRLSRKHCRCTLRNFSPESSQAADGEHTVAETPLEGPQTAHDDETELTIRKKATIFSDMKSAQNTGRSLPHGEAKKMKFSEVMRLITKPAVVDRRKPQPHKASLNPA
jgi:hypothetical protein